MYRKEGPRSGFLADLTTSEGQLHRFTEICHIMRPRGLVGTDRLTPLIQEGVGLSNVKVIRRHLRAMESLGLLTHEDIGYVLSSEGKALCALVPPKSGKPLALAQKVFYLRALLSYVPLQFTSALRAISENPGAPKEQAITSYGKKVLRDSACTWKDIPHLILRLSRQPESPPRKIRNNFDCFRLWLKQLDLVRVEDLRLTELGAKIAYIAIAGKDHLKQQAYWLASAYVCDEPGCLPEFDWQVRPYVEPFAELLQEAYVLFEKPELRLADVRSMSIYVCIELIAQMHQMLSEESFWQLVSTLLREGIFKSAITDRRGQLAYISLGSVAIY